MRSRSLLRSSSGIIPSVSIALEGGAEFQNKSGPEIDTLHCRAWRRKGRANLVAAALASARDHPNHVPTTTTTPITVAARLERYFEFEKLGANWSTEVVAGVTTFITMAYIVFVNPSILRDAG